MLSVSLVPVSTNPIVVETSMVSSMELEAKGGASKEASRQ